MKVIKISDIAPESADGSLFTGGAVTRQPLIGGDLGRFFTMAVVNFSPGARNKFHTHTSDQVLMVTAGAGIVATEDEEHTVIQGDLIHIPAEEKHWHGAAPGSAFSHITLTATGSKTEQLEG